MKKAGVASASLCITRPAERSIYLSTFLFVDVTLDINRLDAGMGGFGAGHLHDVPEVIGSGLAETGGLAVAPGIVLFFHQHVNRPILGQESDRLIGLQTFLPAGYVLFPMFSGLEVT